MRIEDKEMRDFTLTDKNTDRITLKDVVKILEIKNRLLVISESLPKN